MWKESSFDKSKNNEIDSSKKKTLTEEEKLLGLADEILAKKEDVSLGEKTEIIKDYIARNYFGIDPTRSQRETTILFLLSERMLTEEEKESLKKIKIEMDDISKEVKNFFLGMPPKKLESTFGKEELNLIFRVISEHNDLFKQVEDNLSEDIRKFIIKQNKYVEMLPYRIYYMLSELEKRSIQLKSLFLNRWNMSKRRYEKSKKELVQPLKISFLNLKRENKRWQERPKPKTEEEKPIEIQGFEEFDFPEIKGKEIIAKALKILPKEFLATIKSIEFKKEFPPTDESYSLLETTIADPTDPHFQEEKYKIKLYPTVPLEEFDREKRINYLKNIPSILIRKWAYNLDPKKDQKDLTLQEQLKMIMNWEEIRSREKGWSELVLTTNNLEINKINNLDKKGVEESLRSKESFVESVTHFLNNPTMFQKLYPKRAEFITNLFKKRFPEFNLEKSFSAKEEYDALINALEQKVKK